MKHKLEQFFEAFKQHTPLNVIHKVLLNANMTEGDLDKLVNENFKSEADYDSALEVAYEDYNEEGRAEMKREIINAITSL